MWRLLLTCWLFLFAVGCTPPSSPILLSTQVVPLSLQGSDVSLRVDLPPGWHGYVDGTHLLLTDVQNPLGADGRLNGVVVNMWLPDPELLTPVATEGPVRTSDVLQQIVTRPALLGDAVASTPQPFTYSDFDGAYYVLLSDNETLTLVFALTPANASQMVAFNVTSQGRTITSLLDTLRRVLPFIQVNGTPLDETLLDTLPPPDLPTPRAQTAQQPTGAP
jgi:hypothetical protein